MEKKESIGSWKTKGRLALGQLDLGAPAKPILTISVLTPVLGGSIPEALAPETPGLHGVLRSSETLVSNRLDLVLTLSEEGWVDRAYGLS